MSQDGQFTLLGSDLAVSELCGKIPSEALSSSQQGRQRRRMRLGSRNLNAVWFAEPEQTLQDPLLFLSHLMTYTLDCDVVLIEDTFTKEEIAFVIDHTPAGVFDPQSWAFWHARIGRSLVAPLPVRFIPEQPAGQAAE